ncbi:MAG: hypothetical protein IJ131_09785, partial [Eggerthellaceae bacterium]|nr:hypothetical protein [Eggerthellaceae bacterium]
SREPLNRRIGSDKHYGCSNRLCERFDDCARTAFNGFRDIRRKNAPGCFESCPDFREAVCVRLNRAPYVCNGCEREHNCPLKKRYYIASGAQANYRGVLVNCRSGVRPNEATVRMMGEALAPAARQGQSVDAVIAGNVAPEQLSEALPRRKDTVRRVRGGVRRRGEEVPRRARHRADPRGPGDSASLPARAQVPEGGRHGDSPQIRRDLSAEDRIEQVRKALFQEP